MNMSQYIQIIAVVIVSAIYIYGLFKVIKITRGSSPNKWSIVIGFTTATLLLIYLILNTYKIGPADFVQIVLLLGLVMVTGIYAFSTVRMAEEMRDARYDALRPIVDIDYLRQMPIELARQAYTKEIPKELPCKLCNIGVGPATDVYSFVCPPSGERRPHNFGTIATGRETIPMNLSLGQKDDLWFLVAYYKDIYGRCFESSREVRVGAVNPDPLQIREIPCEELPK